MIIFCAAAHWPEFIQYIFPGRDAHARLIRFINGNEFTLALSVQCVLAHRQEHSSWQKHTEFHVNWARHCWNAFLKCFLILKFIALLYSPGAAFRQIEQKAGDSTCKIANMWYIVIYSNSAWLNAIPLRNFVTPERAVSPASCKKAIRHLQADNKFVARGVIICARW